MHYREVPKNGDKLFPVPITNLLKEVQNDMEGFMTKPVNLAGQTYLESKEKTKKTCRKCLMGSS